MNSLLSEALMVSMVALQPSSMGNEGEFKIPVREAMGCTYHCENGCDGGCKNSCTRSCQGNLR